jgi:DNA polymerase-4
MPAFEARRLCPEGIFLPVRMGRYLEVSKKIFDLLRGFAPRVVQVSVDEAFLDLSGTGAIYGSPRRIGQRLKDLIREEVGLTCSVGLAPNRLVAKIASDYDKPDGLVVVPPEEAAGFLAPLPVGKLPGVGPKMRARLRTVGVERVADLRRFGPEELARVAGSMGRWLHDAAWGEDDTKLEEGRERKSISAEQTLAEDTANKEELIRIMAGQALRICRSLRVKGLKARTVTLKLKHSDFRQVTRSTSLEQATDETKSIFKAGLQLLRQYELKTSVRLIGLGLSNLEEPGLEQGALFPRESLRETRSELDRAVDRILERFGSQAIKMGVSIKKEEG